jgi:hypothetical protein
VLDRIVAMSLGAAAKLTLHVLLAASLVASGGMWPAGNDASASPAKVMTTGIPCHDGGADTQRASTPCKMGCCLQQSCDPSACVATACTPHIPAFSGVMASVALDIAWPAQVLPARLIDTPLRPPIA